MGETLEGAGTEKRGGKTKILKRGDKLGQGVGTLKIGGLQPPYELLMEIYAKMLTYFHVAKIVWIILI